jgi:hypothetical protein
MKDRYFEAKFLRKQPGKAHEPMPVHCVILVTAGSKSEAIRLATDVFTLYFRKQVAALIEISEKEALRLPLVPEQVQPDSVLYSVGSPRTEVLSLSLT